MALIPSCSFITLKNSGIPVYSYIHIDLLCSNFIIQTSVNAIMIQTCICILISSPQIWLNLIDLFIIKWSYKSFCLPGHFLKLVFPSTYLNRVLPCRETSAWIKPASVPKHSYMFFIFPITPLFLLLNLSNSLFNLFSILLYIFMYIYLSIQQDNF